MNTLTHQCVRGVQSKIFHFAMSFNHESCQLLCMILALKCARKLNWNNFNYIFCDFLLLRIHLFHSPYCILLVQCLLMPPTLFHLHYFLASFYDCFSFCLKNAWQIVCCTVGGPKTWNYKVIEQKTCTPTTMWSFHWVDNRRITTSGFNWLSLLHLP